MPQDAVLETDEIGQYTFTLDSAGQIVVDDFFDTALLYSIYGEQRAEASEIQSPEYRRGWIGNENRPYENGSKLWLYSQASKTRTVLNKIANSANKALDWLIEDGYVVSIEEAEATASGSDCSVEVTIRRANSPVINRTFKLWNNTGLR